MARIVDAGVAKADLLAPGTIVGRYQLLRRLAIGGMAELHLACARGAGGFQKIVVLKRVLPHLAADDGFVGMFLDEARLAGHLDHPNVVQVIDSGEAAGEYFYAMEYVHGRNARELLGAASHAGGMPLDVAITIVVGVAAALEHAHGRADLDGRPLELVHRDVSPSNILVSYDGVVKLTDFGIAKAAVRSRETTRGTTKGKLGYMSPEQCLGEGVDRRSDIFSLGVVLFELTTCERLFFDDNDFALLNRLVSGRFDRPSQRVADYPPELERIVLRMLATDRDERYADASAVRRDLEGFAEQHHMRLGTDVIAQWIRGLLGTPPYPRVELREHPGDPLQPAPGVTRDEGNGPTAVLADEPTRTEETPPIDPTGLVEITAVAPSRRPTLGVLGAAVATTAVVVALVVWPEPTSTSASARDMPPTDAAPAAAATDDRPAIAPPSVPAVPPPTVTPPRASDAVVPAPDAVAPTLAVTGQPTAKPGRSRTRRDRRPATGSSSKAAPASRDLDALYPDKK